MPAPDEGLVVRNLTKQYPAPSQPLTVVNDVSFDLARGETLAVTGPSGSGKSSLLYILGAIERPTSGSVKLAGEDPFALAPDALAAFRNRRIGFIFQDHHLLPQLTALENVLVPAIADGKPAGTQRESRARDLLTRVGLADRLGHLPAELSGGERQRVAIARALLHQPSLLLADEPTGNLDRRNADAVASLILELQNETNSMLVLVTHSTEMADRFPRRAELVDGSFVKV